MSDLAKELVEALSTLSASDVPAKRIEIIKGFEAKFGGHGYQNLYWNGERWTPKEGIPDAE